MSFDSDFEYDTDSDDCFDLSEANTGTDRFITSDMKFINFKDYPHIYDPFYPHIELIDNQDIMDIIYKFLCIHKNSRPMTILEKIEAQRKGGQSISNCSLGIVIYDYSNLISLRSACRLQRDLINNYMKYKCKKFYYKNTLVEKKNSYSQFIKNKKICRKWLKFSEYLINNY